MPFYDFKCEDCNHVQESLVALGVDKVICASCAKTSKKIFSGNRAGIRVYGGYDSGRYRAK
ncbi:transcriptional regulator [Paraglaciecola Antarctic GD virus 1]|nr:transcriptional regulator [Paraglaciecola Antarctic GD virus 1]